MKDKALPLSLYLSPLLLFPPIDRNVSSYGLTKTKINSAQGTTSYPFSSTLSSSMKSQMVILASGAQQFGLVWTAQKLQ